MSAVNPPVLPPSDAPEIPTSSRPEHAPVFAPGRAPDTGRRIAAAAQPWRAEAASFAVMLTLLGIILTHGLVPAAFFGMLVYTIVRLAARPIEAHWPGGWARLAALACIAAIIVMVLVAAVTGIEKAIFQADWGNLLNRLETALASLRVALPATLAAALPDDTANVIQKLEVLAQDHARSLSEVGLAGVRITTLCLITGIIASMLAVEGAGIAQGPIGAAMGRRVYLLWTAFSKILGAQAKISAINTLLTALYLLAALPAFGVHLPHAGLLIVATFFAAFIPVVGNLLSNGAIVVLAFTVSLQVAASALIFLLVIHQFEYFLNARLVGSEVECKAWEMLCVMLIGESLFGISGVIAGPILYSWAKSELKPLFALPEGTGLPPAGPPAP